MTTQTQTVQLYSDAWQCVFRFLSFADLARSAVCSRSCLTASLRLPAGAQQLQLNSVDTLDGMAQSRMARLVSSVSLGARSPPLLPEQLALLFRVLPSLTALAELRLPVCSDAAELEEGGNPLHYAFPPCLRSLQLFLVLPSCLLEEDYLPLALLAPAMRRRVAEVVEGGGQTLRSITLHFDLHWDDEERDAFPASVLEPLAGLVALQKLTLRGSGIHRRPWGKEHIDVLRSMPELRELEVHTCNWSVNELALLTAEPPPPLLEDIHQWGTDLSAEGGALMARLPSLTVLFPTRAGGDLSYLSLMPRLRRLSLNLPAADCITAAEHVEPLSRCTGLTHLCLWRKLTDEQLCAIMPALQRLELLSLHYMAELLGLRFLSHAAQLGRTLTELKLFGCKGIPTEETYHLRSLPALRTLSVWDSFASPLPPAQLAALRPGTPAFDQQSWPHLATFSHGPAAVEA